MNYYLAKVSKLETLVDNTGDSHDQMCGQLESGSGSTAVHCCANHDTLKVVCLRKDIIQVTGITIGELDNVGTCDLSLSGNACA